MATIYDKVKDYIESLVAGNEIVDAAGTTFTFGTNLFIGIEPDTSIDTITVTPYGGSAPAVDNQRQNTTIRIRFKTSNKRKALIVTQAIINDLHRNELDGNGLMTANQSSPIIEEILEDGEWIVSISSFNIKHVKVA